MGSVDAFPTTLFSSRACWRQQLKAEEVHYWAQRSIDVDHKVFFSEEPAGLTENCILEFPDVVGYFFDVKSQPEPDASAGWGILWRVTVTKVKKVE